MGGFGAVTNGDDRPSEETGPIQAWLELDLEVQPIEGTLRPPDGPPTRFSGWLGLTAALEGLRAPRAVPKSEEQ